MSDLDERKPAVVSEPDRKERGGVRHLFRIAPAVVAVFGIAAILGARSLPFGELTAPGAGFWPIVVAAIVVVTAALLVFRDIPADYERWSGRSLAILVGVAVLGGFIVSFQVLGFALSAFGLLLVWLRFLAREPWLLSLVLALTGAIGLHLIFAEFFAVPFPEGVLMSMPRLGG